MKLKNWILKGIVSLLKPRRPNPSTQKRFLVLSTTGLGDTLWGTPALRALRETYPDCYIAVLTSPIGREILKYNPQIDEVFVVKNPVFRRLFSLWRTLKRRRISHVLSFHISQRPILPFAAILGAQQIIGTKGLHKELDFLLTDALEKKEQHEIQRRLDLVAHVGAKTRDTSLELSISPQEEASVHALLHQWNIPWTGSGRGGA